MLFLAPTASTIAGLMTAAPPLDSLTPPHGRDTALDGFRAVAVLCVIIAHAAIFPFGAHLQASGYAGETLFRLAATMGDLGVRLFFVISGYIITSVLLREEAARGQFSLRGFYLRRALRIVPPFACYLLVIWVLARSGQIVQPLDEMAKAALFTCNLEWADCSWFVGHSWSLAVEEQFYLIWPLLLLAVTGKARVLLIIAIGIALMLGAAVGPAPWHKNCLSFVSIALGVIAALRPDWRLLLFSRPRPLFWMASVALYFTVGRMTDPAAAGMALPLLAAIILLGGLALPMLTRMLNSAAMQTIGAMSYSLYLWQELFLGPQWTYPGGAWPTWTMALIPLCAWASRRYVELPGIALGRKLSTRIAAR